MARCAYCGETMFGGKKVGRDVFCNELHYQLSLKAAAAVEIPDDAVRREAESIHRGPCPRCHGPGPVDVHVSHHVLSIVVLTFSSSKSMVSCRPCGRRSQILALIASLIGGWWGIPLGPIFTPIQVVRNLKAIFAEPTAGPSPQLRVWVRQQMANP